VRPAALITISGSSRTLGMVLTANASACKLTGYTRMQLERRNCFTLLPLTLDRHHELQMRSYMTSGESDIVGFSRAMFVQHKSGHLVPVASSIRDQVGAGVGGWEWL
jgi:PAS domain S-box-containing protein